MRLSILILVTVITAVKSANILYLSNIASPSHFIWCKSLLNSLHLRGHNITALSPDVEKSRERFTYLHLDKTYSALYNGSNQINFFEMGQMSTLEMFYEFYKFFVPTCEAALDAKGYKELLDYPDDFKFDLVIQDFTGSTCLMGMVHKFKNPPMVSVSPYLFSWRYTLISGNLIYPAFLPPADSVLTPKMSFTERARTLMQNLFEIGFEKFVIDPQINKKVQKVHPGAPNILKIEREATKMIFVNADAITNYRIPSFPNVKLVGGVQIQKPKELPGDLRAIADSAKNGLVLFSLGTNVRSDTLGQERILKIIKALGRLPKYTFLWKFETKEKLPVETPKNVHIQPWIPQNDLYSHPNMRLFISHCGLLSTQEALWYGVPVLGFPVFADQPQNSQRLKELGVSEELSIFDFTEDELYETVKKMLENPKYQKKAKEISVALHDQPMTALEEATYWAEWVLRHPEIDLSSPTLNMSLFERHSLDVIAVIFVIILGVLLIWLKIIKFVIKICLRRNKKIDKIKKQN